MFEMFEIYKNPIILTALGLYGLTVILLAMHYLKVWHNIKMWFLKKEAPQNVLRIFLHYPTGITQMSEEHVKDKKINFDGGRYNVTEKAIRHRKKVTLTGIGVDPIGEIHFIYGNPNPILFKKASSKNVKSDTLLELDATGLKRVEENSLIRQLMTATAQENLTKGLMLLIIINIAICAGLLAIRMGFIKVPLVCG